jgi:hypothetical protein
MVKEFSFKYYLETYSNMEIYEFNKIFGSRIMLLPNRCISSRQIMKMLCIDTDFEKELFRDVFLKYFREKIFNDL